MSHHIAEHKQCGSIRTNFNNRIFSLNFRKIFASMGRLALLHLFPKK